MKKLKTFPWGIKFLILLVGVGILFGLLILGLRGAYRGRIYPGITANGVYLGGLTPSEAQKVLDQQTSHYAQSPQSIIQPKGTVEISANDLGALYHNDSAASKAISIGRDGNMFQNIGRQMRALLGLAPPITEISFDQSSLNSFLIAQNEQVSGPVSNATISFENGTPNISESQAGNRINLPLSVVILQNYFGQQGNKPVKLSNFEVLPTISSTQLMAYSSLWERMQAQPLTLTYAPSSWTIEPKIAAQWLAATPKDLPLNKDILNHFYTISNFNNATTTFFDSGKIKLWVHDIAQQINVDPQDASLTVSGGRATVFTQARDGKTLDEASIVSDIQKLLAPDNTVSSLPLNVQITKAAVSDETLDSLGIKELISEGVTYFPGSPSNRLQNVRVGAKKFNGVLLKPGQVFSFGEFLGDVGPEQGYAPGLIILGDHEEKAYGGGLCQVSSTAYRAALLAGLPILQRTNHAFAISYYTAPYGVPGVDATIFYPQVDMKFLNDTGHYILIQTQMAGTTLKFDFYGTKTKSGVIRGPEFVSGNSDPTVPSHTVFYRDVLDLNGTVIKTDTVNTYYKSSLDFPVTD